MFNGDKNVARIEPLSPEELPAEAKPILEFAQQLMGFVANDVLTMARWPELLMVMQQLVAVVYGPGKLDDGLKRLVGMARQRGSRVPLLPGAYGSRIVIGTGHVAG
jgi:hypothetical protein